MRAVVWNGVRDIGTENVPEPHIEQPDDAVIRVTSPGSSCTELHLHEVLGPFMSLGDVLGHEPLGVVEDVGADAAPSAPGQRVVIPSQISCGHCAMCGSGLQAQCENTRGEEQGTGAGIYGYISRYGSVPGAHAEYLRVPRADGNAGPVPRAGARRPFRVPLGRTAHPLKGRTREAADRQQ